jgi:hypothetical protein
MHNPFTVIVVNEGATKAIPPCPDIPTHIMSYQIPVLNVSFLQLQQKKRALNLISRSDQEGG